MLYTRQRPVVKKKQHPYNIPYGKNQFTQNIKFITENMIFLIFNSP